MSDAVSPLNGAESGGAITIRDAGLRGMITLRGDLGAPGLQAAASDATGVAFPGQGEAVSDGDLGLCWMSPDELLVLVPYDRAAATLAAIDMALAGSHYLAADVSDARATLRLEGEEAAIRDALAKLTPADMRPSALGVGRMRRTRLAQVAAAIRFLDEETAEVICFRSVADYVFGLLVNAAKPGAEVRYF